MLNQLVNLRQQLLIKLKNEQTKCEESNMGYAFIFFDTHDHIEAFEKFLDDYRYGSLGKYLPGFFCCSNRFMDTDEMKESAQYFSL